jgi:putative hemolysin
VAVVLCLLGSAFFSGSETALASLPLTRVEALRQRSGRLTRAGLERWSSAPQSLLITILIGNNLVNVLASALATSIAYRVSADRAVAVVVGVMTLVILIFGEITPKTLAQQNAQWVTSKVIGVLYLLDVVLRPAGWVLALLSRALSRRRQDDLPVTEEDLLFMLRLAHHHAQLPPDARHMIESVLRFQRTVAREIMVPRPLVETVDASWDRERVALVVGSSVHSRFPVVDGSPDNIIGVLHAKHLLRMAAGERWQSLVVTPLFIPESRPMPELLQDIRRSGQHLAIVLDEFGGLSGIVTLEDGLELVVGEIEDEFDLERAAEIIDLDRGWLVPGHLSLRRLEKLLQRSLEQPEEIDSVGGLAAALVGGELAAGSVTHWDGLTLTVREAEDGRATKLLVEPGIEDWTER